MKSNLRFSGKSEWRKIFQFSSRHLRANRLRFFAILLILTIGSMASSVAPYIWGRMVDCIASGQIYDLLIWIALYYLIVYFTLILSFLEGHWGAKLNYSAEADIKQELLQKILSLQCKDLDTFDTGRPHVEFCVSEFRQTQEYHVINVHDGGLFPLPTALPVG